LALTFAILVCGWPLIALAEKKETVGAIEEAILLPWNIKILARVDTGAAASSLDARDIAVKGKFVEFKLRDTGEGRLLRLPLVRWRKIRTSEGEARRPVVRLELCLGSQIVVTEVNLNDRSAMEYPFLIGRRLLSGRYIVDVSRQRMIPPKCHKEISH